MPHPTKLIALATLLLVSTHTLVQSQNPPPPKDWTNEQDHQNMMDQLGITALRPGPSGWPKEGDTNVANYDPALANPYPDFPELLVANDGTPITTPEAWWTIRRPEIAEAFETEVYGRLPERTPDVHWQIAQQFDNATVGGHPATIKRLAGHLDNSAYPEISVTIDATLILPQKSAHPVPVLIMFGWRPLEFPADTTAPFALDGTPSKFNDDPPSFTQLVAAGWGIVYLMPNSIQADNGAGLTRGVIGLVNHGQPRKPDDWGALRAWSWGAARTLDYLETEPAVNAQQVGIEGVSRYGKAALVTLAFESRFAIGLIGSSGAGGASPHRRNFGESTENITSSGEYHWMAGNYLKYATSESSFGAKTPDDLPVDSHQLIALCAPRPVFISYGIPENGDALWLDAPGSYMATVAASPAYTLLGAQSIGETQDYRTAQMPSVNTDLLDGQLAWRQHDGGHEDQSNMSHFIPWANHQLNK